MSPIPLQQISVIGNLNTIWVTIFSMIIFKEFPNLITWGLILVSFTGVLLIVDPGLFIGLGFHLDLVNLQYYLIALLNTMGAAFIIIFLRIFGRTSF